MYQLYDLQKYYTPDLIELNLVIQFNSGSNAFELIAGHNAVERIEHTPSEVDIILRDKFSRLIGSSCKVHFHANNNTFSYVISADKVTYDGTDYLKTVTVTTRRHDNAVIGYTDGQIIFIKLFLQKTSITVG